MLYSTQHFITTSRDISALMSMKIHNKFWFTVKIILQEIKITYGSYFCIITIRAIRTYASIKKSKCYLPVGLAYNVYDGQRNQVL